METRKCKICGSEFQPKRKTWICRPCKKLKRAKKHNPFIALDPESSEEPVEPITTEFLKVEEEPTDPIAAANRLAMQHLQEASSRGDIGRHTDYSKSKKGAFS